MRASLVAVALAACGPTAAEIRTAKTATYHVAVATLMEVAVQAAEAKGLTIVDRKALAFAASRAPHGVNGNFVSTAYVVEIHPGDVLTVTVTPHSFQYGSGLMPQPLGPDDAKPSEVDGRADILSLAIYEGAKPYLATTGR